jgi:hypothetical protein
MHVKREWGACAPLLAKIFIGCVSGIVPGVTITPWKDSLTLVHAISLTYRLNR